MYIIYIYVYTAQVPAQVPRKLDISSADSHWDSTSAQVAPQVPPKKQISQIGTSEYRRNNLSAQVRRRSDFDPSRGWASRGQPGIRDISGAGTPAQVPQKRSREKRVYACGRLSMATYRYLYLFINIYSYSWLLIALSLSLSLHMCMYIYMHF